jgi:hypothetical protein
MSDLVTLSKRYLAESWSSIIDAALAIPAVMVAQRDAPLPSAPAFATMHFSGFQTRGYPDFNYENYLERDVKEALTNSFLFDLSANFYRAYDAAPVDYAKQLHFYLQTSEGYALMASLGFGLGEVSPPRDVPDVYRAQWEERTQMDIQFSVKAEYIVTLPAIESVDITGELQADGTTYNLKVSNA